jgi:hypothetical protein
MTWVENENPDVAGKENIRKWYWWYISQSVGNRISKVSSVKNPIKNPKPIFFWLRYRISSNNHVPLPPTCSPLCCCYSIHCPQASIHSSGAFITDFQLGFGRERYFPHVPIHSFSLFSRRLLPALPALSSCQMQKPRQF